MPVHRSIRRAFTLLELVVAMLVISIISVAVMPVIVSATDAYAANREARSAADDAAFAASTIVRLIQEAPGSEPGGLAVASGDTTSIVFTNGIGLRLDGGTLVLIGPDGNAPFARRVEQFRLDYVGPDGITPVVASEAHRVHARLTIAGFTLSTVAFPRVNIGDGP